MKTFKANDMIPREAARMIKNGNTMSAKGKKQTEAGKAMLDQWLREQRGCDLASLPIGEIVNIETICLVEIGKQTRLDQATMQLQDPVLFAKYQKEFATVKFKPLV